MCAIGSYGELFAFRIDTVLRKVILFFFLAKTNIRWVEGVWVEELNPS